MCVFLPILQAECSFNEGRPNKTLQIGALTLIGLTK